MGQQKPSIGAPKQRVRQNCIRTINNPYGRNGRTGPVIGQETSRKVKQDKRLVLKPGVLHKHKT